MNESTDTNLDRSNCANLSASAYDRLMKLAQLDREGLGPALDMMLGLFVGHGLHKTGAAEGTGEQRWRRLNIDTLTGKALGHIASGRQTDAESGLPNYAHGAMRVLMLLQREIERRQQL